MSSKCEVCNKVVNKDGEWKDCVPAGDDVVICKNCYESDIQQVEIVKPTAQEVAEKIAKYFEDLGAEYCEICPMSTFCLRDTGGEFIDARSATCKTMLFNWAMDV